MEKNYIKKYEEIIKLIDRVEPIRKQNSEWLSRMISEHPLDAWKYKIDDETYNARKKLQEIFPNIKFSETDIISLSQNRSRVEVNNHAINTTETDIKHQHFGGKTVSKYEKKKLEENKKLKPILEQKYYQAYTIFFIICESINGLEQIEPNNIEQEFEQLYKSGLNLRPKNKLLSIWYETYVKLKKKIAEKESLETENKVLQEQLKIKIDENSKLQNRIITLEETISTTINSSNTEKKGLFGSFKK